MNDRHDAREGVEQNPAYRWTLPLLPARANSALARSAAS